MTHLPIAKRIEESERLIAKLAEESGTMSAEDFILFIYNNAIEDCVAALDIYAKKNPIYRQALAAAAQEINYNWPLVRAPGKGVSP